MIRMLNTNLEKFWTLLWLENVPPSFSKFSWDQIFIADKIHETMYVLEIVEAFLVNDYWMLNPDTDERKMREVWVPNFIKLGGF